MSKNLVIVESPAKAKTIAKYLGKDFVVKSSFGHIRDLPKKGMSVEIQNNFKPIYEISPDKTKTVRELKTAAKNAELVWLASDEDREGEAIAWHLSEVLGLKADKTRRIVFHEITKPAIEHAVQNPRKVDIKLVDAQQARRILDRIVGYELSPVLWKKVRTGLSAGRVQSVAVRLIVEREREIEKFEAETTFKVTAKFTLKDGTVLQAESPKKYKTEDAAHKFLEQLAKSSFAIKSVGKTPGTKSPGPPFTTSTLQQEASRKLGYSPKQTMMLAQRLYEEGHITYMRTDSLNLSGLAIGAMSDFITKEYGADYLQTRKFTTKTAGAQEAHEAIRPTHIDKLQAGNDAQQIKLYQLIWRRAVASQMAPAKVEKTTVTIAASESSDTLEAKGEVVLFPGYLKVYASRKEDGILPDVTQGDKLDLINALAEQVYSRAQPRYTEASLIRKLEELGIGRPSTYAPTISTIQVRGYVEKADVVGGEREVVRLALAKSVKELAALVESPQSSELGAVELNSPADPTAKPKDNTHDAKVANAFTLRNKKSIEPMPTDRGKLVPTDIGKVTTDFLVQHFPNIVDYDFTKDVEQEFDDIAEGKTKWQEMLHEFYGPFHKIVEQSDKISRAEAMQARVIGKDPKTGKPISARFGRFGPMVQMGEAEDEEKPKFASIPTGVTINGITLSQALELFKLPKILGQADDGQDIEANNGRFGPYVKVGKVYVSIKPHDPSTITLKEARDLIKADAEKRAKMTIQEFPDAGIKVLNGRFGPYITNGKTNAKVPKDTDPKKLSLKDCQKLLETAPSKPARKRRIRSS